MRFDRTPVTVLFVLAALAAIQLIHYYPRLPATLAVHFGPSGHPNGWQGKLVFHLFYGGIEAMFVALGLLTVTLGHRFSVKYSNLPNKAYWFTEERKSESTRSLVDFILWYDNLTLAFLIAIAEITFRANLGDGPLTLPRITWAVILAFSAAIVFVTVRLYQRFSVPQI